jgi:aminoglycoside phosphotransferase (APT) family kinase protein
MEQEDRMRTDVVHEAWKTAVADEIGLISDAVRISLRPPLDHQSNRLYDVWAGGRRLILKEFLKPDEFHAAPLREIRALELLASLDIAPQPVFYHPPAPPLGPIVVYEFMQGEMWDRRRPSAAELTRLAEIWLEMNAASGENLWLSRGQERSFDEIEAGFRALIRAYADWVAVQFPSGQKAVELVEALLESRRAVVRELKEREPILCFCRSDSRFANVIGRPDGRLGMVDWEDSGLRDPARDLADIMTHPNQEDLVSPDEWEAFLQPYLAVRARSDPDVERRMQLYLAVFPIFWLLTLLQEGVQRAGAGELLGWDVNGLPANEKLRRYLARGLAWPEEGFGDQMEALEAVAFFPSF